MTFKMTPFIFWTGIDVDVPTFLSLAGLEHSSAFMGLVDCRLFSLHQCGTDSGLEGFAPACFFRVLGIDTPLHRRSVADSCRSFRGSGPDCRTLGFG